MNAPHRLLVDHLVAPLGTSSTAPRLSWWLPEGAQRQDAFQVQTSTWDAGRIDGTGHGLVPYDGPRPAARERVEWRVKVWTDLGESDWSDWSSWEVGLLGADDWSAQWIAPNEPEHLAAGERPAHLLRHEFTLESAGARARVYATAHGLYELFLNGERIGDLELTPGTTAYRTHLDVQTYDVEGLLVPGSNVLGAVLSDGWWRGQTGFTRETDCFGREVALLAQLEVTDDDGGRQTVGTGPGWTTSTGDVLRADLIDGETVDLRRRHDGWDRPGFDDGAWAAALLVDGDLDVLSTSPSPPVRRIEELRPADVRRRSSGRHVVDLGQNINGWVRLRDLGPDGTTSTLVHARDARRGRGRHHRPPPALRLRHARSSLPAGQVDVVVSRGRPGDAFEPRHTTHGFRYVGIDGHPGPLDTDDVTGVVVHTDLVRTGWFTCSDDRLNRLHDVADWSFRGNACDVPTDCPQRERAGWTGDWQLFCPTAAFLYDVAGFSAKWLRDLRADQWPDGRVPNILPDPRGPDGQGNEINAHLTGSAGWGDAAVIVPWVTWVEYGDLDLLDESLGSMAAWVDFAGEACGRGPSSLTGRSTTRSRQPTRSFLWDSGFHWGEWCEPGGNPSAVFTLEQDMGDIATAFLHRSSSLLARAAALVGRDDVHERYRALADAVLSAWRAEFIDDDGRVQPDTQANLVRALAFGLVPDALRASVADRLVGARPRGRRPPGDRLPGDTVPAPGAGRQRPPGPGLHAPLPGHATVLALR